MPSKKKKFNARFPPARIKKIMQADEEVGKVAAAVPVVISRALELFVDDLLARAAEVTSSRNAKTLTPSHIKNVIMSVERMGFLHDMVAGIPDLGVTASSEEMATASGPSSSSLVSLTNSISEDVASDTSADRKKMYRKRPGSHRIRRFWNEKEDEDDDDAFESPEKDVSGEPQALTRSLSIPPSSDQDLGGASYVPEMPKPLNMYPFATGSEKLSRQSVIVSAPSSAPPCVPPGAAPFQFSITINNGPKLTMKGTSHSTSADNSSSGTS